MGRARIQPGGQRMAPHCVCVSALLRKAAEVGPRAVSRIYSRRHLTSAPPTAACAHAPL